MALADPPFLNAFTPTVEIDGMSYPIVTRNLERMRMEERLGGLSSLELVLTDAIVGEDGLASYAAGQGSPLALGAGLRIFGGPHAVGAAELFDGQITAIEAEVREGGAPTFAVIAEDRLFPLRRRRRTHFFEAMNLGAVVGQIAGDFGLTPEIRNGIDTTARNWMQADETDLAFLRRILSAWDCDMQIVGDKLQVGRIGMDQRTLVRLDMGSTLKFVRMTADVAEQVNRITLGSFDPQSGDAVEADEEAKGFGPGSGKSGPDILGSKFSTVSLHQGRQSPMTDGDAQQRAIVEGNSRARGFVRVTGRAQGNAQLRVGSWIELAGVNPMFANQYAVHEAIHIWDFHNGYVTDFIAESAYLGEAA